MSESTTDTSAGSLGERWTSRKFWAMMIWEGVMVWLLISEHLPVDAFVSLTWLLLGGYFVGNVAQSILGKKDL